MLTNFLNQNLNLLVLTGNDSRKERVDDVLEADSRDNNLVAETNSRSVHVNEGFETSGIEKFVIMQPDCCQLATLV